MAKGRGQNANGRLRRWLPRQIDIDQVSDEEVQDIVITANLTPRKCLGFKSLPGDPQRPWQRRANPVRIALLHLSSRIQARREKPRNPPLLPLDVPKILDLKPRPFPHIFRSSGGGDADPSFTSPYANMPIQATLRMEESNKRQFLPRGSIRALIFRAPLKQSRAATRVA